MARTLRSDKLLFWATLLLLGLSVVMVYSATAVPAAQRFERPAFFLIKQMVWVALGLGLLVVAMRIDYHEYRKPALIWMVLGITTVALLAVFAFAPIANTHRWLNFGLFTVQPSEFAKLAAIFFTAALLERRMHRVDDVGYALAPIGIVTFGLAALIVYEPDFGTAAVLVFVVAAILFAAGLSYRYLFGTALVLLPTALLLVMTSDYRRDRLLAFLQPELHAEGVGYQLKQSLIAFGSGGVFGSGLMGGIQKLYYLPEPHSDFIYAVIGEELGLIGTTLVLLCFGLIAWRGLRTALLAPDRFGALLAIGLTMMVALQAFLHICVNLGLMPTKGIPLPLVSSGGSSLLVNLVAIGILLNISQHASPAARAGLEGRG